MSKHSRRVIGGVALVATTGLLICGCGGGGGGDIIGTPPSAQGQVQGVVANAYTSSGVYPATVSIGGQDVTTQTDGSYSTSVNTGTHSLSVSASGFEPFPRPGDPPYTISVSTGVNVIPDVLLVPAGTAPPSPPS